VHGPCLGLACRHPTPHGRRLRRDEGAWGGAGELAELAGQVGLVGVRPEPFVGARPSPFLPWIGRACARSALSTFGAGPFVAGSTHKVLESLGACTVPVGPGDTERVLSALRAGLVDTMLGTPTFGQYLANVVKERGLDARVFGLRHILSGGEPGGGIPAIKESIEQSFAAEVTEIYGLGDITPSLMGECPVGGVPLRSDELASSLCRANR
jgi:hypothetical protein